MGIQKTKKTNRREKMRLSVRGVLFLFIFMLSGIFCAVSASDAEMKEKLAEFEKKYPAFDTEGYRKEAERRYKSIKEGDYISLNLRSRTVSGNFKKFAGGKVYIGRTVILFNEVPEHQRYIFNQQLADRMRREYVNRKYAEYVRAKKEAIRKYRFSLERKMLEQESAKNAGTEESENTKKEDFGGKVYYGIVKKSYGKNEEAVHKGGIVEIYGTRGKSFYQCASPGKEKALFIPRSYVMALPGKTEPGDVFDISRRGLSYLNKEETRTPGTFSTLLWMKIFIGQQ